MPSSNDSGRPAHTGPRLIRQFTALGTSTLIRVMVGFVLFVLIAREWRASLFGEFMYFFAVAALLVQVCEYGFSQQILREVGFRPDAAPVRMGEYFAAKAWLTLLTWVGALVFMLVGGLAATQATAFALLLCAGTLMSFSDFLMSCYRATGRYARESRITLLGNLVYFVLTLAALYSDGGLIGVAAAIAGGRLFHLAVTIVDYRKCMPRWVAASFRPSAVWPVVWRGGAYGLNVALGTAMVNLDTVLISHTLGFVATGEYQAAARFYQGAALLPPVFAGVFLPRMSREVGNPSRFGVLAQKVNLSMLLAGGVVALVFLSGVYWHRWIYPDPSLAVVGQLLPWFGLLALVQFVASAQGIAVTALGGQSTRAMMLVVALILLLVSAPPLMHRFGVAGMVFAVTAAYLLLALAFWLWNARNGVRTSGAWAVSVLSAVMAAALVLNFLG